MNDFVIRKGKPADVPQVLNLIKELAVFEREPDAVKVSEEELLNDGFGDSPAYRLLVAEKDGEVVAMSLYYYRYSTWNGKCIYLEDLVVTESERGKGIGKALFEAILGRAREEGCRKMNWQVLDWNTPAIDFYKAFDADLDGEWINGSITLQEV